MARFGSRNCILTKFIDDSASFLPEKLKNHVILTINLNIGQKIQKIPPKSRKIHKNPGFPRDTCGDPCGDPWGLALGNPSSCKVCLERGPKATYAILESHQAIEATGEWPSDHGCEAVTEIYVFSWILGVFLGFLIKY